MMMDSLTTHLQSHILKETSDTKSEIVLLKWAPRFSLRPSVIRFEARQHFYYCHVRCHELFIAYAKLVSCYAKLNVIYTFVFHFLPEVSFSIYCSQ